MARRRRHAAAATRILVVGIAVSSTFGLVGALAFAERRAQANGGAVVPPTTAPPATVQPTAGAPTPAAAAPPAPTPTPAPVPTRPITTTRGS